MTVLPPEAFNCPLCTKPSGLVLSEQQAFCTNNDCQCIVFIPSLPDGGLANAKVVELPECPGE